jgi:tetratricopeptide (TPR) repeat protein
MRLMFQTTTTLSPPAQLPDEKQVREWLTAHRLQPASPWAFIGVTALLIFAVFMLGMGDQSGVSQFITIMLGVGVILFVISRARKIRNAETDSRRVHELTVTRQWRDAFELAWKTIPGVTQMPEQYARTLACMAYSLDQLKRYDSAIYSYKLLLEVLPSDHSFVTQVQTHMAIAMLANDELSDADDRLRKLRLQAGRQTPVLKALISLADLIQITRTYHYADALAIEQNAEEMFRPLGVEAGFGYALLAYARQQLAEREIKQSAVADFTQSLEPGQEQPMPPGQAHLQAADQLWGKATLLVSPQRIVDRFPMLSTLLSRPATPSPVWDVNAAVDTEARR